MAAVDEFFDRTVDTYDAHYDAPTAPGYALRSRLNVVLDLLGNGPGEILDAGMGPGRLCAELADRGWTVSGVDVSEEMVARARERLPEARDRLLAAPVEQLPFRDASFDAVTVTGALEYVHDLPRGLRELVRVLRPGGRGVLSFPNSRAFYALWYTRLYYPTVRALRRVLPIGGASRPTGWRGPFGRRYFEGYVHAAGFEIAELRHASYLVVPSPLDLAVPAAAARLAAAVETRANALGNGLATQLVYAVRKTTGSASTSASTSDAAL